MEKKISAETKENLREKTIEKQNISSNITDTTNSKHIKIVIM